MEDRRMPRPFKIPAYQHHQSSGQARVRIKGRDVYLGVYGSEESKRRYDEVVRAMLTQREREAMAQRAGLSSSITVAELVAGYLRFSRTYYLKNGRPTNEYGNIALAVAPVLDRHGDDLVTMFGPRALKAIRDEWIKAGLVRASINRRVDRIRRMFAWGVAEELVPVDVLQALRAVKGLARGRTVAAEGEPVRAVADAHVDAIRGHVSRQVWAMVELQRLTGARPGEIAIMRTCDVDTSGQVWEYRPSSHKSEHRDKSRAIFLGPQAQAILAPWLRPEPTAYLFSPAEAMAELWAARRGSRKTRVQPSQRARTRKPRPKKAPRERYTTTSYNRAIGEGIKKANRALPAGAHPIPHWSAHQLRHSAATRLRREFNLDVARTVLGHTSAAVTAIYAEQDRAKAADAMGKMG
jgi:integrase